MKNPIPIVIDSLDAYQQKHSWLGFLYAVIKKYGDDESGHQAALITYYGFLSLFPLLMVVTSVLQLIAQNNPSFRADVLNGITNYFPSIGGQLQDSISSSNRSGVALIVGLLLSFYGARGGADAFRCAVNHIWHVPKLDRAGFPWGALKSLAVLVVGGIGLLLSTFLASYIAGINGLVVFKIGSAVLNLTILVGILLLTMKLSLSQRMITIKDLLPAAIIGALSVFIIQNFGTYLLANQLKNMSALYGTFAVVLGLLFWIYIQVQVVLYAIEISTVRSLKLWPRSLGGSLASADKQVYKGTAIKNVPSQAKRLK